MNLGVFIQTWIFQHISNHFQRLRLLGGGRGSLRPLGGGRESLRLLGGGRGSLLPLGGGRGCLRLLRGGRESLQKVVKLAKSIRQLKRVHNFGVP